MNAFTFLAFFISFSTLATAFNFSEIKFNYQPEKTKINEGNVQVFRVNVMVPAEGNTISTTYNSVQITTENTVNAVLTNGTTSNLDWYYNETGNVYEASFEFEVMGRFVGYFSIDIKIFGSSTNGSDVIVVAHKVTVIRTDTFNLLSQIFTVTMTVLICINTFVMGLQLDWKIILGVLRRPVAPLIGFCCQFLIMPLVNDFL